jgi:hypothetical protein
MCFAPKTIEGTTLVDRRGTDWRRHRDAAISDLYVLVLLIPTFNYILITAFLTSQFVAFRCAVARHPKGRSGFAIELSSDNPVSPSFEQTGFATYGPSFNNRSRRLGRRS